MSNLLLQSISEAATAAIASFHAGVAAASKEITTLRQDLTSKRTLRQELSAELVHVKKKLDGKHAEAATARTKQQELSEQLAAFSDQLDAVRQQKLVDDERVAQLEQQMVNAAEWQERTAQAEKQTAILRSQLARLRAGLLQLANPVSSGACVIATKTAESISEGKQTVVDNVDEESSRFICAMDASCALNASSATVEAAAVVEAAAPDSHNTPTGVAGPNNTAVDSRYKTRLCSFHQRGVCRRGANCLFAHGEKELLFNPGMHHRAVSAVAAMGFNVDIAVIGALFDEYDGNAERVINHLTNSYT